MVATNNNNPTTNFTTDYEAAANVWAPAWENIETQHEAAITARNQFSWVQQLLLPAIQAAANILILEYQKKQYDEIEERRIGYIESAVEGFCACMDGLKGDLKAATDDVPAAAMYQPFSPHGEQRDTICTNKSLIGSVASYSKMISENHVEQDLARAVALNPNYLELHEFTWTSIEALMRGDLPVGLTVETLTRSAENSTINGRLGRASGQFRRDIGLVDYRVQKAARAERREELVLASNAISRMERQADIRDMMVKPEVRFGYALQQAQLIQNSLQNAHNSCARKAPYLMQQLQVELQKCTQTMQLEAGKAGLVSGYVPNFAGVLNSQVRDLSSGITNGLGHVFGGNNGGQTTGDSGWNVGAGAGAKGYGSGPGIATASPGGFGGFF